jgi:hypothetical protein
MSLHFVIACALLTFWLSSEVGQWGCLFEGAKWFPLYFMHNSVPAFLMLHLKDNKTDLPGAKDPLHVSN